MTKVTRLTLDDQGGLQNRRLHLREISGDIDAPLETVGQDLRAARLRRGDDLATVSRALKIRKDHLEALEEDRLDALPGRTYAIGFVRSYADYLGLDSVQSVERFKSEIAGRADHITPVQVIDEDDHRRLPQGWMIIAGVVILLLIYGAYHLAMSADQMLTQPVTPPPPQAAAKALSVAKAAKTVPAAAVAKQKAAGPVNTATATAAAPPAAAVSGGGQTIPAGSSPSQPGAAKAPATIQAAGVDGVATPGNPAAQGQQLAALPPGQVYGAQNHTPRVVLRVHSPTKVLVMGPGGMIYINRALKPGDTYQLPNLVGLTLTTPNGGAVEVELDGASMGYAGHDQEMKESLSLDPQAIVDRYNGGRG